MTTSPAWGRASLLHLAIVACLCQMTQAHAADASPASHLQIAAQPLGQALTELAAKTGMLIGVDADLVRNKQAKPINGQYQPEDALTALLAGSGLQAVKGNNGSYTLKSNPANVEKPQSHAEPATLPEVSVSAANESSTNVQDEGKAADGYRVKTISSVGALGSMRLQDTPYAMSVIPQELIQNIQAQSPDDVYKLNPSTRTTTPQITGFSPNVNIRGFGGYNTAEDGMRRAYNHAATMEDKERVEVLNGLSGFLYGAASPGGMINFVYKRPTMERLNSVTLGNYGGSQYYAHGDFGGRIDDEGRAGYRLNVVKQEGDTAVDHQSIQRELISGAIDWQITDKLLLELNAAYNHYRIDGVSAYWFVANGIQRPSAPDTSKYWGQKWSGDEFHNTKLMGKLTYQLNDHVTLRGAYMRDYINREGTAGTYNYPLSSTTYRQLAMAGADTEDVFNAGQAFADIRFDTGSISHKVTTGYYMNSDLYRGSNYSSGSTYLGPFSISNPTYVAQPTFAANTESLYTQGRDINENLMLGDLVTFNEHWSMLAGVNRSRIMSFSYSDPGVRSSSYDKSRTSPAASLIYKPAPWLTSYLSYIEGLEAGGRAPNTTNYTNRNEAMPAMVSRQQELGLKASVGKVLLTTAIFEIEKAYQYTEVIDSSTSVYRQNGRQNHKGIEFGATGKATDRLTLITGLTLMDATVKKSENAGNVPVNVAKQFAKVYSEYQIPGVEGLTLTGGVYYTGKQYADDANTDRLPSYVTADIGARYQTVVSNRPLTLRLNVNNLFDKDYWLNAYYLGTPRSLAFSAQMQF